MSQAKDEVLSFLESQQGRLDQIANMLETVPTEISNLSNQVKDTILAIEICQDGLPFPSASLNTLVGGARKQKDKDVLQWLSPLNQSSRHQDIRSSRLTGTGTRFLQSEQYTSWRGVSNPQDVLACYGIPGAGKTIMTSSVIDDLRFNQGSSNEEGMVRGIAYMYCDYRDHAQQCPESIMGAILQQLLSALSEVPDYVVETYEKKYQRGQISVELSDIMKWSHEVYRQFNQSYICVDALDECYAPSDLLELLAESTAHCKLFITSRKHVQSTVQRIFPAARTTIIEADALDIARYVEKAIEEDQKEEPDLMDHTLKTEILERLMASSMGMFLLPTLHIRTILEARTKRKRRQALEVSPTGLYGAFEMTIERIKIQSTASAEQAMAILMWTYLSQRPLTVDEARHALSIEVSQNTIDWDNFPSANTWLNGCMGLVVVDSEPNTLRLVHYSLHEYLERRDDLWQGWHERLARTCLSYLQFDIITAAPDEAKMTKMRETVNNGRYWKYNLEANVKIIAPKDETPEFTFLQYAASHWGHHVAKETRRTKELEKACLEYLALPRPKLYRSLACFWARLARYLDVETSPDPTRFAESVSEAHIAAAFNVTDILATSLAEPASINAQDEEGGYTPLVLAASLGNLATVELSLKHRDILVDHRTTKPNVVQGGLSALAAAALFGHEAVLRLLLSSEMFEPDAKDDHGRTALMHAAENGHERIVELLLDMQVDPGAKDDCSRTALSLAAGKGHEHIAQLLLQSGRVDPQGAAVWGRTPLYYAVQGGHLGVVKLLLDTHGVDPDVEDGDWRTPLSYAAQLGEVAIAKVLLQSGRVRPDAVDGRDRTPLSYAADYGCAAIVRMLLETGQVEPDSRSVMNHLRTPLFYAAQEGFEDIVGILLQTNRVDPDARDENSSSPLGVAAWRGHGNVVQLLLDTGRVDLHVRDYWNHTPLEKAAERGHTAVVQLLSSE